MVIMRKFRLMLAGGKPRYYASPWARDAMARRLADETGEVVALQFYLDDEWTGVGAVRPAAMAARA